MFTLRLFGEFQPVHGQIGAGGLEIKRQNGFVVYWVSVGYLVQQLLSSRRLANITRKHYIETTIQHYIGNTCIASYPNIITPSMLF